MALFNFLVTNWDSVLVVLATIVGLIILYKRGEIAILKEITFALVTKAEEQFGGGTGELKKATVVEWIYDKLPLILKIIITRKEIDKLIDDVLVYAKEKWKTNPKLQSIVLSNLELTKLRMENEKSKD